MYFRLYNCIIGFNSGVFSDTDFSSYFLGFEKMAWGPSVFNFVLIKNRQLNIKNQNAF